MWWRLERIPSQHGDEGSFSLPWALSKWPRCLLWHGWLPGLGGISDGDFWASSFVDLAFGELERCLGAYPVDFSGSWTPPEYWMMMNSLGDVGSS